MGGEQHATDPGGVLRPAIGVMNKAGGRRRTIATFKAATASRASIDLPIA
jgi:hypothetical protein